MRELILTTAIVLAAGSALSAWYWRREAQRLRRGVVEMIREVSQERRVS
ncbi:MAG: hypothetical protein QME79_12425 [Bacillota bacterium]|nr:hypothetical protein [Bacillota bacterium]